MQPRRWTGFWVREFEENREKRRATLETIEFPGGFLVINDTISTFPKVITLGRRSGRTGHSRQSEKIVEKPSGWTKNHTADPIWWYPLQNLTQIPAKPKWVRSGSTPKRKQKPPQSRKARGWFSAADFSEKQCYLYNRYC